MNKRTGKSNKVMNTKAIVKSKSKANHFVICNSMKVYGNGQQPKQRPDTPALKFVDTFVSNFSVTAVGTVLPGLVNITQGSGVSQRVGNRIYLDSAYWNFNIVQANTDINAQVRVIIFQFIPNSSFLTPVVLDILETVNDCQSMYNWEFSNQYKIIDDLVFFQSGLATAPTTSTNVGYYGTVDITRAIKTLEFTAAGPLGSNQLYMLVISDSLVAPFPILDSTFRLVYRD